MAQATTWQTSVAYKIIMALTGLFLISFLVVHLAGNLLLLRSDGGEAFNAYAEFMSHNPAIRVLEILLFAGFIFHIYYGVRFILRERRYRPQKYALNRPNQNSSLFSRTMKISGLVILLFLLVHLRHFFVEKRLLSNPQSMYDLVKTSFEIPAYSLFYALCMILLAFHLAHGFYSGFQTLGLVLNRKIQKILQIAAAAFAFLVPLGFAIIPLYFLVKTL
ncbi:MAG: succinate dehydrogenase cytochrome b subunit [Bacteroidia bacterium]